MGSANMLWKDPHPAGGMAKFKLVPGAPPSGVAGGFCYATQQHVKKLREDDLQGEINAHENRTVKLIEYHYETMEKGKKERVRLQGERPPAKTVGAVPGYSGFLPRLESEVICGGTFKECSLTAAEIFAAEQEHAKVRIANITPPDSGLTTPS